MKPTSENTNRKKVLFLCSGNSCRSQMAEAIVNKRMNQTWQAYSAGTRPSGYVHPKAIQVLAEMGIEHQGESKSVQAFQGQEFDLVVTVCDAAAEECPLWLGPGRRVHRGFVDPAKARGSEAEVLEVFRRVRDEILEQIPVLLAGM
jgi:arsenate reductase